MTEDFHFLKTIFSEKCNDNIGPGFQPCKHDCGPIDWYRFFWWCSLSPKISWTHVELEGRCEAHWVEDGIQGLPERISEYWMLVLHRLLLTHMWFSRIKRSILRLGCDEKYSRRFLQLIFSLSSIWFGFRNKSKIKRSAKKVVKSRSLALRF